MKTLFFSLFLFAGVLFAQELQFKVTANYENLPVYNKEVLGGFARTIQEYLNNTKFSGRTFDAENRIQCTLNIYFTGASDQTNYTAQVFLSSQRPIYNSPRSSLMLKIIDNSWSFNYEKGQSLYFYPNTFEPITAFLNFYAYLILGIDEDSYKAGEGTEYFKKAFDMCSLGQNGKYSKGWEKNSSVYSRRGIIDDLLSEKFRPFREACFDYHYNGLDLMSKNKVNAQNKIANLVNVLDVMKKKSDIKGVLVNSFFEAKYSEIIENLKDYPDKEVFKKLKKIDPPHASKYDEALGN
jgi:hypothetical protein